jgi:hypothetical protein
MENYVIKGSALLKSEHFCLPQVACFPLQGTVLYLWTPVDFTLLIYLLAEKPEPEIRQKSQPGWQVNCRNTRINLAVQKSHLFLCTPRKCVNEWK